MYRETLSDLVGRGAPYRKNLHFPVTAVVYGGRIRQVAREGVHVPTTERLQLAKTFTIRRGAGK